MLTTVMDGFHLASNYCYGLGKWRVRDEIFVQILVVAIMLINSQIL